MSDHPFSEYLRILGKGPKSRRSLTQAEAASALKMILSGQVTEKQLGAFLLLMRANGESPQELIGFVKGLRSAQGLNAQSCRVDLDWAAYAGKWRYPPYFLLSVKLLNQMGYRVLLHGDSGQFDNRQYASDFLAELNFHPAESLAEAAEAIEQGTLTYLPLEAYAPALREILHLKSELGVRTVFNTAVKLLNPLNAPASLQGIFHKGVEQLHHDTAKAVGVADNLVFKGEGGEAEIRPDAMTHLFVSRRSHDSLEKVVMPGVIERQTRPKGWRAQDLSALWQGARIDAYGEQAVMTTAAAALMLVEKIDMDQAMSKAHDAWIGRMAC